MTVISANELKTRGVSVVQEALHNATRHAQATNVRVVVRQEPSRLLVVVQDNGRGFDLHMIELSYRF